MKRLVSVGLAVLSVAVLAPRGTLADHDRDDVTMRATLRGAHEVPPINTAGSARFTARVHRDDTITFKLTFANLSSNLVVSHIHFAQFNVNGGVMIFLCGGDAQPACPAATSGTIEGTIAPANVVGPAGQGIAAGDLASALRAIGQGEGYANIHTVRFGGGEIRGQIQVRRGDDDDDD